MFLCLISARRETIQHYGKLAALINTFAILRALQAISYRRALSPLRLRLRRPHPWRGWLKVVPKYQVRYLT